MANIRLIGTFNQKGDWKSRHHEEIGTITAQARLSEEGLDLLITDQELSQKLRDIISE